MFKIIITMKIYNKKIKSVIKVNNCDYSDYN